MEESAPDYGRDPDIPLGRGYLGERPFGDRPYPAPGHERFREPWNAREVHADTYLEIIKSRDGPRSSLTV